MINTVHTKKLEQFKKQYEKLLAKYPELFVMADIHGDIHALIGKDKIYLPSCTPVSRM